MLVVYDVKVEEVAAVLVLEELVAHEAVELYVDGALHESAKPRGLYLLHYLLVGLSVAEELYRGAAHGYLALAHDRGKM